MNWVFRTGTVLGGIALLSVVIIFWTGGFGPCGGTFWGLMSIIGLFASFPMAALFLLIGVFMELRPKRTAKPELV